MRGAAAVALVCALAGAGSAAAFAGDGPISLVPASLQPADAPPAAAAAIPPAPAEGAAAPSPGADAAAAPAAPETPIQHRLDEGRLTIAGETLHVSLLRQFYAAHNYQPVWPTHQEQAQALLGAVLRAGDQGLNPDLFHAALLRSPAALPSVDRDLLLSDAFLSYADALARGILPIEIRMDDEDLKPQPVDIPAVLDKAIDSSNPAAAIEALAPHSPAYRALQQALLYYRSRPSAGYDRSDPGGRIGDRVRQIEVNLERLRWLPRKLPADRVWVNTASATLTLVRDNRPEFASRVVVGKSDKQTPDLETKISGILFNPPWYIPPSIVRSEILPKLDSDPDYLRRHHMVWRAGGELEQLPPSALGHLKFEMADRFDVYLHDTPERYLFARSDRRRSHGCVRVQNPYELASLLLHEPVSDIEDQVATGTTHSRPLRSGIPVFVVYQTVFLDSEGRLAFVPDVYQRDNEIWQHLHPAVARVARRDRQQEQLIERGG